MSSNLRALSRLGRIHEMDPEIVHVLRNLESGLIAWDAVTVTSNYTASDGEFVLADASSGSITITMPSPSEDTRVAVKKIDSSSNTVTISPSSSETFDGMSDISMTRQYDTYSVIGDGTNYNITNKMVAVVEVYQLVHNNIVAGEDIDQYDIVYFYGTTVKKANAGDSSKMPVAGMALSSASSGDTLDVLDTGRISNSTWSFTAGLKIFANTTDGSITTTPPSNSGDVIQVLGRTLSSTLILFEPEERTLTLG